MTETIIKSTNRKGGKGYGSNITDKVYTSSTERYFWSIIDEERIKYIYKDKFTGKYQIIIFLIK
tara:strand:+ start:341 stop:532 length:192 start_codon:yes stop_codon:yes gene_type:complete